MEVVEIEVVNWEKFNPRTDRKTHSWFRLENGIAVEPKFFGLSAAQKFVAICLFAEASKSSGGKAKIHVEWLADILKMETQEIRETILNLVKTGVLRILAGDQVVSGGNQLVTTGDQVVSGGCPTYDTYDTNVTNKKAGGVQSTAREANPLVPEPPPPALVLREECFGIHPALAGNSLLDQVLTKVPIAIQEHWIEVDEFDLKWLKGSLLHAIQKHAGDDPVSLVRDWPVKLTKWFNNEKKPKFRAKSAVIPIKEPEKPHCGGPIAPEIAEQLRKVKSRAPLGGVR